MERHPGIRREGFSVRSRARQLEEEKQFERVKWDWVGIGCISRMENDKRRVKLYQLVIFIFGVHVSSWGLGPSAA
jgi:hypothetical protein